MSLYSKTIRLLCVAGLAMFISANTSATSIEDGITERLKPVGEVCMSGTDCAAAPVAVSSSSEPRSGTQVYDSKCAMCHASGAAGAPKFGDAAAWAPRIGQGMETLYTHAIAGFNGMPAKGLCMDCSDDEVKAAVDYLADGSK